MHVGMADSAENVAVIREIANLVCDETNGYNLSWWYESVNVERIDRESVCNIQ